MRLKNKDNVVLNVLDVSTAYVMDGNAIMVSTLAGIDMTFRYTNAKDAENDVHDINVLLDRVLAAAGGGFPNG